jgi:hypothetical protein
MPMLTMILCSTFMLSYVLPMLCLDLQSISSRFSLLCTCCLEAGKIYALHSPSLSTTTTMHTISPFRLSPRRKPVIWLVFLVTVTFLFSRVDRCTHTTPQSITSTFLSPSTPTVGTETTQPGSNTHGFNLFDNLYLRNGTFYIVTSIPSSFMPRNHIVSRPIPRGEGVDIQATDQVCIFLRHCSFESGFNAMSRSSNSSPPPKPKAYWATRRYPSPGFP